MGIRKNIWYFKYIDSRQLGLKESLNVYFLFFFLNWYFQTFLLKDSFKTRIFRTILSNHSISPGRAAQEGSRASKGKC